MDAGLPISILPPGVERRLLPAAALLWLERAWRDHLRWPAIAWAGYTVLALFGTWETVAGGFRVGLLFLLALGTLASVGLAIVRTPIPRRGAILRRIEQASRLRRGSLALLDDRPIDLSDPVAAQLWARARTAAAPKRLRLGRLRLGLIDSDRYALLPILLLAAVLGLMLAGGEARQRLGAAFSPYAVSLAGVRITATIEAPAYAMRPAQTVLLTPGRTTRLVALKGSKLALRVDGPAGEWRLLGPNLERTMPDERVAVRLDRGGRYTVERGWRLVARLNVELAADGVPLVRFDGKPAVTATSALRIAYRLEDDHGAAALMLELARGNERRRMTLEPTARPGAGVAFADLTPDPWAGEDVTLRLLARDGAGQIGHSPELRVILPERQFNHPVARTIIAARKQLLRAPERREPIAQRLTELAADPESFGHDFAVFSGLRAATWRLAYAHEDPKALSTARLLWDIAVDLDDNGATRAMDELRRVMDELAKKMGRGDDQEMARLADQLTGAMADYLRRQLESMMQAGLSPEDVADMAQGQAVDLSFLDQMLQDLRDRMAAGDQAGAMAALANLRQLMESIRFGGPSQGGSAEAARAARQAAQAADALRDIEARQRDLQAETIAEGVRRSIEGREGPMEGQAATQGQLERGARALRQQLEAAGLQSPQALGEANRAMTQAEQALRDGRQSEAMAAQGRAIEALKQAGQALEEQARAMAQAAGGMGRYQPGAAGSGLDPLGRPGAGFGQGAVKLPDVDQLRRVEAIRRLLEERAADPGRSAEERAYYLRLLKRF